MGMELGLGASMWVMVMVIWAMMVMKVAAPMDKVLMMAIWVTVMVV